VATKYFQEFLEQLNATGHLKADNYDLSLFHKLPAAELHQAEELLIQAFDRGDWNGIDALCLIGSARAIQALEDLFPKVADNRFLKFKLAIYLFDKTGNPKYQAYMKPDFDSYDDTDRLSFVRYIPLLPDAKSYLEKLFDLAVEDRYNVVRFYAGVATLRIAQRMANEEKIEEYRPILSQLADKDKAKRTAGIHELKNLLASHSK
jgi:hypothetical protein